MTIKPRTCKSNRREWWLLKCRILTKVQTISNTEHIRLKQKPQQTSAHWHWNMTCSARARPPHAPALHRRTSFPSEGDGFRLHPGQSTCITGPISRSMFINMYKSVTGTWNVFGWKNPTLQDHVFTERPDPGRFSRQWSWFLVSQKMESCRIRHQPKPPSQDKIQDCSDAICWVCLW